MRAARMAAQAGARANTGLSKTHGAHIFALVPGGFLALGGLVKWLTKKRKKSDKD